MTLQVQAEMAEAGDVVRICQLFRWFGVSRSTFYYRQVKKKPKSNQLLAACIDQIFVAVVRCMAAAFIYP